MAFKLINTNLVEQDIKLDVLVNNAAICTFEEGKKSKDLFEKEWTVNYLHTRYLTEQILEKGLLKESGKVINTSSGMGNFRFVKRYNPEFYNLIQNGRDTDFDLETVTKHANICYNDHATEEGKANWGNWTYSSTKLFLNLFTIALSKDPKVVEKNIQVYGLCPGYTDTGMTSAMAKDYPIAPKTPEEGAQTTVYLVRLPHEINKDIQGAFFRDEEKIPYDQEMDDPSVKPEE